MSHPALQIKQVTAVPCGEKEVPVADYTSVATYAFDLLSAPNGIAGDIVQEWSADSNSNERTVWFRLSNGRYAYANQRVDHPNKLDLFVAAAPNRHGRCIVSFADLTAVAGALGIDVNRHTWIAHDDIAEFIERTKRLPPGAAAWYNGKKPQAPVSTIAKFDVARGANSRHSNSEKPIDAQHLSLAKQYGAPALQLQHSREPARSHIGGAPGLPKNAPWPKRDGRPLDFVLRLSLAEIQKAHRVEWLPVKGALLFFFDFESAALGHDPVDRSRWAVLHVADLPRVLHHSVAPDSPIALKAAKITSVPGIERFGVLAPDLPTPPPEVWQRICESPFNRRQKHQVGGFPYVLQADNMHRIACELASDPPEAASSWRLLLQLDTGAHRQCPDIGMLYFWVKAHGACAGDFDSVVCFRQRD